MDNIYDPNNLNWNNLHTINEEHTYCYCGKDRNLTEVSLQCSNCLNWFHAKCTKIPIDTIIPIFTNYKFTCKWCSNSSGENFKRSQAGWKEIGGCAIANLMLQQHMAEFKAQKGDPIYSSAYAKKLSPFQFYFNKNEHLRPFVDKNWSSLCTERSRTATWWATLGSCLYSTKDLFVAKDENNRSASSNFCLVDPNLWNIRPGHFGTSHSRTPSRAHKEAVNNSTRAIYDSGTPDEASSSTITHASPSKRQSTPFRSSSEQPVASGQTQSNRSNTVIALMEARSSSITEFGQSGEQNNLRHGFKYLPCQLDKLFPYLQYRNSELPPYGVRLSKEDASLSVWISGDQLTSTTDFGFSMARANCPVKEGKWFFEVFIDRGGEGKIDGKDGAHVRVGWARREGNRNSPVGSDAYSYGFRDLTGQKIHQSRPAQYGESFKTGDVIGLYINLPPLKKVIPDYQPKSPKRHRIPILFKGDTIFEYKDFKPTHQMNQLLELPEKKKEKKFWWQQQEENKQVQAPPDIPVLPGSKIIVYKNGVRQGVAFDNLYSFLPTVDKYTNDDDLTEDDGSLGYYPAVSMYRGGTCTLNFGPHFRYPPPPDPELEVASNRSTAPKVQTFKSSLIKTLVANPLLNKPSTSTSSSPSSLNPCKKSTSGRNWNPMSERYMEYVTEDVLYDIVDEVELWDWMLSQKKKVIPTKRPVIVELSDGSLKKRKQEGGSRQVTNDNEDLKPQGFPTKWDGSSFN
ncbi:16161_t:CDS:2 [Funneliformis geosporum]|uniref:10553_t:CDS:1 n=1 Tax=Funneliformis geosporum TaxID=1117311 RepID=A0A9W4SS97_9GLOM|nr:16161_t:CDS:2 [Funneliformis geosporum]CAI2178701.1 10553_t:CDS:2 [Funneliformis geosporum]